MKIQFAGVGSAFTTQDYWQSNMVVTAGNQHLLIDCGGDARFSLKEIGLTHRDINAVYISHLHADHIGGLEWLGFATYFDPKCPRPKMFIVEELIESLWESLKAGMQSHEGLVLTLESFFDVVLSPYFVLALFAFSTYIFLQFLKLKKLQKTDEDVMGLEERKELDELKTIRQKMEGGSSEPIRIDFLKLF